MTQNPPNDGALDTVGSLVMAVSGAVTFSIVSAGKDKNDAWLANGGALRYTIGSAPRPVAPPSPLGSDLAGTLLIAG